METEEWVFFPSNRVQMLVNLIRHSNDKAHECCNEVKRIIEDYKNSFVDGKRLPEHLRKQG